jgi:O-antigen/teichoic acid export membrane protein
MPKTLSEAILNLGTLLAGEGQSDLVRRRIAGGLSGLLSLRALFSALTFAGTLLLARTLGAGGYGIYAYSLAWVTLLAIPSLLGADQLLVREVAASQERAEWGLLRGLLQRANGAVLAVSVSIAAVAAIAAWLAHGSLRPQTLVTFWMALPFLPLITLTRVRQATMQGLHRVALGALPEQLVQPGLLLAFLAAVALFHLRLLPPVAMAANVGAAACAFALGAWLLFRTLPPRARYAAPVYRNRQWIGSALPLMFLAGVSALFGQADTLILGAMRGGATVGIYSVAHKGSEMIGVLLNAQISAFASSAASLYALGDRQRLQNLVTRLTRVTLLASAPIALGFIVFAKWFLMLYGPEFVPAHATLAILSVGQLVNVGMGCVGVLLVVTGNERDVAVAIGAGAAANVVLSFALAPRWGAEGVAAAYVAGMILWNGWAMVALYRKTGIDSTAAGLLAQHRSAAALPATPASE